VAERVGARASAITSEARALSVVIPTWNGGARFRELLLALASQDVEHELVVIDSGSRDGTAEAARASGACVLSIPQSEFNHGATRNRAIAATHGEIVALLTQDALPMGRDYLTCIAKPFANPGSTIFRLQRRPWQRITAGSFAADFDSGR